MQTGGFIADEGRMGLTVLILTEVEPIVSPRLDHRAHESRCPLFRLR